MTTRLHDRKEVKTHISPLISCRLWNCELNDMKITKITDCQKKKTMAKHPFHHQTCSTRVQPNVSLAECQQGESDVKWCLSGLYSPVRLKIQSNQKDLPFVDSSLSTEASRWCKHLVEMAFVVVNVATATVAFPAHCFHNKITFKISS